MIEVSGKLEPEDYVRSQYLHIRPRPTFAVVGVLLLCVLLWAIWYTFFGAGSDGLSVYDLLLPAFVLYLVWSFFWHMPRRARRIFNQQRGLQREFQMRIDDAGISISNDTGHASIPWSDYLKWKENSHIFLMYSSDAIYQMIPKRLFLDEQEMGRFRKLLEAKIGRSAA